MIRPAVDEDLPAVQAWLAATLARLRDGGVLAMPSYGIVSVNHATKNLTFTAEAKNYHGSREQRVFNQAAGNLGYTVVRPADVPTFDPSNP